MRRIEVFAPAKINLTLHVTGQREDGYHLLDSLVAFANFGDTVIVEPADDLTLEIEGHFGASLCSESDNLVLRAARLFGADRGAAIKLVKRLPIASGIGGGSADAAATLRALAELWQCPIPAQSDILSLGADVPVCMSSALCRMQGIGDQIVPMEGWIDMGMVLVNPGIAVSTPKVFANLNRRDNAPMRDVPARHEDNKDWLDWLGRQRNDLEAAAIDQQPVIAEVLEELRALPGCRLARMSGSGATCFGLFDLEQWLDTAPMRQRHPNWWIVATETLPFHFDHNIGYQVRANSG